MTAYELSSPTWGVILGQSLMCGESQVHCATRIQKICLWRLDDPQDNIFTRGTAQHDPGPWVKASSSPISPSLPHEAHSVGSAVISRPKISYSKPAAALASSISSWFISVISSISSSSGAKTFGADLVRVDSDLDQNIRSGFDHQRRPADEDLNCLA